MIFTSVGDLTASKTLGTSIHCGGGVQPKSNHLDFTFAHALKHVVMMDEDDIQPPPQKKLKANHSTMDGTIDDAMENTAAAHIGPIADLPSNQQDTSYEQLRKEAECGITEFVSPELSGFTGILKKRYYALGNMISLDADISIVQVHGFSSQ